MTLKEQMNHFFIDYDLIPLLVHENILDSCSKKKGDLFEMERIALASDSIARSDNMNNMIRGQGQWGLLPNFGFNSVLLPCQQIAQFIPFCRFPSWFGKYSSTNKIFRELKELRTAIGHRISSDRLGIKFDYSPALLNMIRFHYINTLEDKQGVEDAVSFYEHYDLTPQLVKEHLVEVIYNPDKKDLLGKRVTSKMKRAVTVSYNKRNN